jgi:hypothetical protein
MTDKEFLENRQMTTDHKLVFNRNFITLEELNSSINDAIKSAGNDASDIKFYIDYDEYNDDGRLMMTFKRLETKEETERRFFNKKMVYENAIKNLEHLITLNPKEAVEIIKKKGLI